VPGTERVRADTAVLQIRGRVGARERIAAFVAE
jgi:hypothetical protein